jgi:hypothetical protein
VSKGIDSKKDKTGAKVQMQVAHDIRVDDKIVIPKGTPAFGEITKVEKNGAFGKSGKLFGRVLFIQHGNINVPITGSFDERGQGATGATVAVAIAAGVFAAFVKGKNAELNEGTQINATIENDVELAL